VARPVEELERALDLHLGRGRDRAHVARALRPRARPRRRRDEVLGRVLLGLGAVAGAEHRLLLGQPRLVLGGLRGRAPLPQPAEHAAARLVPGHPRGQVAGAGLADPAVMLGAHRAEVADLAAVAARREVPLSALALQDRSPTDVAADGVVNRP
jgi:hypothetical protein